MSTKNHIQTLRVFITRAANAEQVTPDHVTQATAALDSIQDEILQQERGPVRVKLEEVQGDSAAAAELRAKLSSKHVLIYSREHQAYWRRAGNGYTDERKRAGLYTFPAALEATWTSGPEKAIEFELTEARHGHTQD